MDTGWVVLLHRSTRAHRADQPGPTCTHKTESQPKDGASPRPVEFIPSIRRPSLHASPLLAVEEVTLGSRRPVRLVDDQQAACLDEAHDLPAVSSNRRLGIIPLRHVRPSDSRLQLVQRTHDPHAAPDEDLRVVAAEVELVAVAEPRDALVGVLGQVVQLFKHLAAFVCEGLVCGARP